MGIAYEQEEKMMKHMKLGGFLVVLLLISTTFMPLVSAAETNQEMAKIADKLQVSQVSGDEKTGEYVATYKVSDTETKTYYLKKYAATVDGKDVVKVEVYEKTPSGSLTASSEFGKDSYATYTGSGWSIHLGPVDMGFLRNGGTTAIGAFGAWLAVTIGLTGGAALIFAAALVGAFIIGTYFYTNADGSMDINISDAALLFIPIAIAMPGPQPVPLTIKGIPVILPL